jgi:hypothetical protein
MTNYALLKDEITKPIYDGMTDAQIAAAVNVLTTTLKQSINTQAAINKLIFVPNGDWSKIAGVISGTLAENNQAAKLNLIGVHELFTRNTVWDTSSDSDWTAFIAAVDTLISQGRMSTAGKTLLVDMGRPVVLSVALWGWPNGISEGEIPAARNWS